MRTPEQDARFADATTAAILAELQRHASMAVLMAIDARIINEATYKYPSGAAAWAAYGAARRKRDSHQDYRAVLGRSLEAYIINGDDPSAALKEARAA